MDDLAAFLLDLATRMTEGAKRMHQQATRWDNAGLHDDADRLFRHAKELRGAAQMMRNWAKGIAKVPAPGSRPAGADHNCTSGVQS